MRATVTRSNCVVTSVSAAGLRAPCVSLWFDPFVSIVSFVTS